MNESIINLSNFKFIITIIILLLILILITRIIIFINLELVVFWLNVIVLLFSWQFATGKVIDKCLPLHVSGELNYNFARLSFTFKASYLNVWISSFMNEKIADVFFVDFYHTDHVKKLSFKVFTRFDHFYHNIFFRQSFIIFIDYW